MRLIYFAIIFSIGGLFCYAQAKDLIDIKDTNLVHILNDSEILAETHHPPYAVRVVRLRDHGECSGTPQSCPKQTLYIAVSNFGESPDQKLFVVYHGYGWEFIRWKTKPKKEGRGNYIIFIVKKKAVSKNIKHEWWVDEYYEIGVNPFGGYIRKIAKSF